MTVILFFRTTAPTAPQTPMAWPQGQAHAQVPPMAYAPQPMYMNPGGMPQHPFFANQQFWAPPYPQQPPVGMHMPMNGFQGYPGMFPGHPNMQQWQQMPANGQMGQNGNPPRVHRVHINLRLIFSVIVIAIALLSQGSSPNWYFIVTAAVAYAFMNGWFMPRARQPAAPNPQQNGQANAQAQNQPYRGAADGAAANQNRNPVAAPAGVPGAAAPPRGAFAMDGAGAGGAAAPGAARAADQQNQEHNPAFDRLERDPPALGANNVPAMLRYDWRHHTGVVGEVLGFVCPLVFSLWPSWDPSILGDHPDVIRRRQAEALLQQQQAQQNQGVPPLQPDAPAN